MNYVGSHVNGQTSGQGSSFHIDYKESGTYTVVLFTEENWNTQWEGRICIFDKEKKEYKYTTYIPNRGFDPEITNILVHLMPYRSVKNFGAFSYYADDSLIW